jgi:hypothetical protein
MLACVDADGVPARCPRAAFASVLLRLSAGTTSCEQSLTSVTI